MAKDARNIKLYRHSKTVKQKDSKTTITTDTTTDITAFVTQVEWSGATSEASRTLTFNLINSPHDKNMKVPVLAVGEEVSFYEGGVRLFCGKVTGREQIGEMGDTQYTAKDFMHLLLRSKITQKWKNMTAEQIAKKVCGLINVQTGDLIKTKVNINKHFGTENSAYAVIMNAYGKASDKTGVPYFPRMKGKQFEVIEKGSIIGKGYNAQTKMVEENFILSEAANITGSRLTQNNDEMVNRVNVYNNKGALIGTAKNAAWISQYGTLQETQTGGSVATAKTKLRGAKKEMEIEAIGDQRCIAGYGVKVRDTAIGKNGLFWIESDTHTWQNGNHMMSLVMAFQNIMERVEMQYNPPESKSKRSSSSGSSLRSTGIQKGRKVKALFTGYYPHDDPMEGGFNDAQGHRLDPSKYTCAAPKNVPFGKYVQPLGIPGKHNRKLHRVNDRGGAITVVNGRYHFDLLFATNGQCNKFGVRKGHAIIGNGAMKTKVSDDAGIGGSAKGKKLVKFAKKFIGKCRYVLGHSNPNSTCDCSGYVMYCYRHALGISLPHYSVDQAKKGRKISKISKMRAGDIVIMHTGWRGNAHHIPDHVGIYAGNGKILQVGHSGCTYKPMSQFRNVFLYARRLF